MPPLLLVGLGNPGPGYRSHRHNVGFMAIDRLHERLGVSEWREKYNGLAGKGVLAGREAIFLKPQTFMNLSGRAVLKAVTQRGIKPADIIVAHDELDLPFERVMVKSGGGHGGHNGLRDISAAVGSEYQRVRVGIGRPVGAMAVESFVLSAFSPTETIVLASVLDRAAEALEYIAVHGVAAAMNQLNGPPPGAKPAGKRPPREG